jgi:hypothetical protein
VHVRFVFQKSQHAALDGKSWLKSRVSAAPLTVVVFDAIIIIVTVVAGAVITATAAVVIAAAAAAATTATAAAIVAATAQQAAEAAAERRALERRQRAGAASGRGSRARRIGQNDRKACIYSAFPELSQALETPNTYFLPTHRTRLPAVHGGRVRRKSGTRAFGDLAHGHVGAQPTQNRLLNSTNSTHPFLHISHQLRVPAAEACSSSFLCVVLCVTEKYGDKYENRH